MCNLFYLKFLAFFLFFWNKFLKFTFLNLFFSFLTKFPFNISIFIIHYWPYLLYFLLNIFFIFLSFDLALANDDKKPKNEDTLVIAAAFKEVDETLKILKEKALYPESPLIINLEQLRSPTFSSLFGRNLSVQEGVTEVVQMSYFIHRLPQNYLVIPTKTSGIGENIFICETTFLKHPEVSCSSIYKVWDSSKGYAVWFFKDYLNGGYFVLTEEQQNFFNNLDRMNLPWRSSTQIIGGSKSSGFWFHLGDIILYDKFSNNYYFLELKTLSNFSLERLFKSTFPAEVAIELRQDIAKAYPEVLETWKPILDKHKPYIREIVPLRPFDINDMFIKQKILKGLDHSTILHRSYSLAYRIFSDYIKKIIH